MMNQTLSNGFLMWYENVMEIKMQRVEDAHAAVEAAKKALEDELTEAARKVNPKP
jgi:hypothetical protein